METPVIICTSWVRSRIQGRKKRDAKCFIGPQLSEAEKVTMDIPYVSKTLFPVHAQNYKGKYVYIDKIFVPYQCFLFSFFSSSSTAAGVLPYRVKEGRVEVLLGYEKRHSKTKAFLVILFFFPLRLRILSVTLVGLALVGKVFEHLRRNERSFR